MPAHTPRASVRISTHRNAASRAARKDHEIDERDRVEHHDGDVDLGSRYFEVRYDARPLSTRIIDILHEIDPGRSWRTRRAQAAWRDFIRWPPDVFALTSILLEEAALYRFAASPPPEMRWPPSFDPPDEDWYTIVTGASEAWAVWASGEERRSRCPATVEQACKEVFDRRDLTLETLRSGDDWPAVAAVLNLHALADEACAGLGLPLNSATPQKQSTTLYWGAASSYLGKHNSLSRLSPRKVRVLPKMRTPQVGITPRSMSLHAAIDRSELDVSCALVPRICEEESEQLNLLLLPWPKTIQPRCFKPVDRSGSAVSDKASRSRYFEFVPSNPFDFHALEQSIRAASRDIGKVHGIVLPEGALAESEIEQVIATLTASDVPMLLSGVRGEERNFAQLAVNAREGGWKTYSQDKHHRWRLDDEQIRAYHLGAALHPDYRWWECMNLNPRSVTLLVANSWLTMSYLICEDLARTGPAVDLVRSMGPTLVIALLLDGPQLAARWPGRYASVLADDPGSSVLTLTALGMAERSRPEGRSPSRKVALWKDAHTGVRELELAPGAEGILLSLSVKWVQEFSVDGRGEPGCTAQIVFGGAEPVFVR